MESFIKRNWTPQVKAKLPLGGNRLEFFARRLTPKELAEAISGEYAKAHPNLGTEDVAVDSHHPEYLGLRKKALAQLWKNLNPNEQQAVQKEFDQHLRSSNPADIQQK